MSEDLRFNAIIGDCKYAIVIIIVKSSCNSNLIAGTECDCLKS